MRVIIEMELKLSANVWAKYEKIMEDRRRTYGEKIGGNGLYLQIFLELE